MNEDSWSEPIWWLRIGIPVLVFAVGWGLKQLLEIRTTQAKYKEKVENLEKRVDKLEDPVRPSSILIIDPDRRTDRQERSSANQTE